MMIRMLAFLVLCLLAVVDSTFFLIAVIGYGLVYQGTELLLPAVAVDGFFGVGSLMPYYTVVVCGVLMMRYWLSTRSLFYTGA